MARLICFLFAAALAGCGAGVHDSGVCSDVSAQMTRVINASQPCAQASDCAAFYGPCGAPDQCGVVVSASNASTMTSLENQYEAGNCAVGATCPPCPMPPSAACVNGACAAAAP